jgi:Tol biopolymer transport system component
VVVTISPNSAAESGLAFTLTVNGSNFVAGSVVEWNGSSRTTSIVTANQLRAQITGADLSVAKKAAVTVFNPAPGGGSSNAATFTIAPATIAFTSARALDGSNTANTNGTRNIWVMNPDSSNQIPLTQNTATNAFNQLPHWSPDGSKIVFQSARALDGSNTATNGTSNIWVMNADGSDATPLTKITALNASSVLPHWSPDGNKIVFFSLRALDGSDAVNTNFAENIWVMNADGSNQTPLTKLTAISAFSNLPVWSPDGSKIIFQSAGALDGSNGANTNSTSNVWVMNADGSGAHPLTRLTAPKANSLFASWSPDGSKIVFESQRALDGSDAANINGTVNIWVMNADGSAANSLTKLTAADAINDAGSFAPNWAPDGTRIVFESRRALDGSDAININGTTNNWIINADGSGAIALTKLTAAGADSINPVWSPDGSKIVFSSQRAIDGSDAANTDRTVNIWVMNADGSFAVALTKLTATGTSSQDPNQPSRDSEIIN